MPYTFGKKVGKLLHTHTHTKSCLFCWFLEYCNSHVLYTSRNI